MFVYEEKEYYTIEEITDLINSDERPTELESFVNFWYECVKADVPKEDRPTALVDSVSFRIDTLLKMKKLTHLECKRFNDETIYLFFNLNDLDTCMKGLTKEERSEIMYTFEVIKLVEAE